MPNRKAKEAMKVAKQAAARQRDKTALEKEGARLRAKAAENDLAGQPSIVSALPEMSVSQRKRQRKNRGLVLPSGELKGRVLSKNEVMARRKGQ
jgi:hypothetical protein